MNSHNINATTGIRYGVISGNSLHPEVLDELYLLASSAATARLVAQRRSELTAHVIEVVQGQLPCAALDELDVSGAVDQQIEAEGDSGQFDCEEPSADIEYEGYKLHYSYLGGAPLIFVMEGPVVTNVNSLCSPCVPGAADLDSGFCDDLEAGYVCYGVPETWLPEKDK